MKFSTFALFCWLVAGCMTSVGAQTNKKIKALESQKKEIQKGLKRKQTELASTRKDVEEKIFGREADRRRKLYNGRLEVCYYQFHGTKPSRKEKSDEKM